MKDERNYNSGIKLKKEKTAVNKELFLCPVAKRCGGCQMQGKSYAKQLAEKQKLADKLLGLQSIVTVMERNAGKRARAESMGCSTTEFSNQADLSEYDYVFNTVPAPVLGEEMLQGLSRNVTIIDIASGGVGVDYEYCKNEKINAKLCLGLPGKYAPKSSATILLKVIEKALGE